MAKKKVTKLKFETINGNWFKEPLLFDVYWDNFFFIYAKENTEHFYKNENIKLRQGTKGVRETVIGADSVEKLSTAIYYALAKQFATEIKEEKIISYRIKFNSVKHYFNHEDNMTFSDTPALSINWNIRYRIIYATGETFIQSHPYEGFGSICSNKFSTPIEKYKEKYIEWTEDRQLFFESICESMEKMIEKLITFFGKDKDELSLLIDSKSQNLIG